MDKRSKCIFCINHEKYHVEKTINSIVIVSFFVFEDFFAIGID